MRSNAHRTRVGSLQSVPRGIARSPRPFSHDVLPATRAFPELHWRDAVGFGVGVSAMTARV